MIEAGSLIRSLSGRPAARNFHTFVINEIGHGIATGKFPVGSILASDAVMMETYGVSRTVLREALKTLEAKGMVEARPKVGTRVSPSSRWNFFDPQVLFWHYDAAPNKRFYDSLFDVRQDTERRAVMLACVRRTAEQVRLMKYWVHQMDVAGEAMEAHALASLEVHQVIADSSGNPLLRSAIGVVELTLALAAKRRSADADLAYQAASCAAHQSLVTAVEGSDTAAAVEQMQFIIEAERARAVAGFA
ncbi:FadR/GntR family transcriptional regulator [Devosia sp.]|uniref:FadR/GntR family transcriptional regulator n=1 Tax=Devosia sp. TaxID=1871048 RepID=UPI0032650637